MMADLSPSSSLLAEQEVFNRQSASHRRLELSNSLPQNTLNFPKSPTRNPNQSFGGKKSVTIFDHIVQWFRGMINHRCRVSAGVTSIISALIFSITVSILRLSIWSPFSSMEESLTWFFHPNQWIPILVHGSAAFALSLFVISTFCKVDQFPRVSIVDTFGWSTVGLEFVNRMVFVYLAFLLTESRFLEGFAWIATSFGVLTSSTLFVFKNDFHLTFPQVTVDSVKSLVEFARSFQFSNFIENCLIETAIAFSSTIAFVMFIGPVVSGFDSWWLLVNIPFLFNLLIIFFGQQFYWKLFMRVVNQVIMKPLQFPFPPPFTIHSPTPEQTRTLTNVIEADDPLLKMFALYDLRKIAWNDELRRRDVFSLSQPGGHARNWKAVSGACIRILDELYSKMTASSARLVGCSWGDHNDEETIPRDAILMPRRMREVNYGVTNRNVAPIRSLDTKNNTLANKIIKKVGGNQSKAVITRYEAQMNSYAAEAVYMLVVDSLGEDRYGVVQKDLKDLISLLCRLISSIDTYERARASVAEKSDVTFLKIVDFSLQSSLQRVVSTFGNHLSSLNLPQEHIRTIRLICPNALEEF